MSPMIDRTFNSFPSAENSDAANAAYQVGYESPSQFSRECSRMFGAPPIKDIERLRIA